LGNIHLFFSDMEDLRQYFSVPLSIDWAYIAARLLVGFRYSRKCGVREVEDVIGGEWIPLSARPQQRVVLWHPAKYCLEHDLEDEQEAARTLRRTILNVTHTLAGQHSHVLLRLSGGLDSSIVAACIAQQNDGPGVTCLNFYIATDYGDESKGQFPAGLDRDTVAKLRRVIGSADERAFARLVATRYRFNLVEREKRARDVRLQRLEEAPLVPRPSHFVFMTIDDEVASDLVSTSGASACFGGEAGDTVFYNTQRAIGALDYAYQHPLGLSLFRHIATTSNLSREPYARVLWKAIKHGLLHIQVPEVYDLAQRPHLLADDAAVAAKRDSPIQHPWLEAGRALCPGKRTHVSGIANCIATYPHPMHAERSAPTILPLASQPVVELCLRIPTYVLLLGGVSRGLARSSFRDLLPPEIVRRTVKGGTMAFLQDTIRRNLPYIRERLMDGHLVHQGLLDRVKLGKFLVDGQSFLTVNAIQLMDYVACEGWVAQMDSTMIRTSSQPSQISPNARIALC
jgi:asparagine synthase (glutamine-hydrolysing)